MVDVAAGTCLPLVNTQGTGVGAMLPVYFVADTGRSVYEYAEVLPVAIDGRTSIVVQPPLAHLGVNVHVLTASCPACTAVMLVSAVIRRTVW